MNLGSIYRGRVEDNNHPDKNGKVRVRIFGIHSEDTTLVPTSTLPWAECMQSLAFGYGSGTGITSLPRTGTLVFLILENENPQMPIVIGAILGKAQEDSKFDLPMTGRTGLYDINDLANPGYPDNHVIETLAGHIIEIDDSSGSEKIRINHRNGNEVLLNNEGIAITSVKDRTETTAGKFTQTVLNTITINSKGAITINTSGSCNINSNGKTNIKANGDMNLTTAAVLNIQSFSDSNITIGGNAVIKVAGNTSVTTGGTGLFKSGGVMTIEGSSTFIKGSPVTIQGNSTMVI